MTALRKSQGIALLIAYCGDQHPFSIVLSGVEVEVDGLQVLQEAHFDVGFSPYEIAFIGQFQLKDIIPDIHLAEPGEILLGK